MFFLGSSSSVNHRRAFFCLGSSSSVNHRRAFFCLGSSSSVNHRRAFFCLGSSSPVNHRRTGVVFLGTCSPVNLAFFYFRFRNSLLLNLSCIVSVSPVIQE